MIQKTRKNEPIIFQFILDLFKEGLIFIYFKEFNLCEDEFYV